MTLDSIGKKYGITRERVRQIENLSIKKLKEGKVKTTNARQFLAELKEELAQ
jgi:DNA-directed RNA polymerase sigma subunit (sigma70/sigma32)